MSERAHELAILQGKRRVRYLKLIAIFKIAKGVLLFALGFSLIVLNSRTGWMDAISDWADDELVVVHSKTMHYLLNALQAALANGHLRTTGLVALFYSAVLFTEGTGVYFQRRWGEFLMIFATSTLIPFEAHHLWIRPSVGATFVLGINCFIVWFLYLVLKRDKTKLPAQPKRELIVTR